MKSKLMPVLFVVFNVLLGIPGYAVLIYCIFGFFGFMTPPTAADSFRAAGVLTVYLLIWLIGNGLMLRRRKWRSRLAFYGLSVLIAAASGVAATHVAFGP